MYMCLCACVCVCLCVCVRVCVCVCVCVCVQCEKFSSNNILVGSWLNTGFSEINDFIHDTRRYSTCM